MLGKLLGGGIATLLVAVLTVSSVSGMGGGSGPKDDDDVTSAEDSGDNGEEGAVLAEGEEPEDSEDGAFQALSADDPAGALKVATAIADEFEVTPEEVMAFHDEGIGFGALFKLYAIAEAKGMTVEELLATLENEDGEYAFAFGNLKKSLTEEELAILEEGPKNLGELVSAASKGAEGAGTEEAQTLAPAESSGGNAHGNGGPPAHAQARGQGKKKK